MKNLLTVLILLLSSISLFSDELKWVDEQIEAIKPPRNGISSSKVNSVKDPFIFLKKNKDKSKKTKRVSKPKNHLKKLLSNTNKVSKKIEILVLDAIINNSAFINGKWYKLMDKVGEYTLSSVDRASIILSYKKKQLFLTTDSKNKNLKFKNN